MQHIVKVIRYFLNTVYFETPEKKNTVMTNVMTVLHRSIEEVYELDLIS